MPLQIAVDSKIVDEPPLLEKTLRPLLEGITAGYPRQVNRILAAVTCQDGETDRKGDDPRLFGRVFVGPVLDVGLEQAVVQTGFLDHGVGDVVE